MSAPTKIQTILGCFLINKDLHPEDVGVTKSFFKSTNERLVFSCLDGSRDTVVISDKLRTKIRDCHSYLSGLVEGINKKGGVAPERVRLLVSEVKKDRLRLEVAKKIDEWSKSGIIDHDKIKELYGKIDVLDSDQDQNQFLKIAKIEPAALSWLWYNRIPFGSYSAICGDPGDGKSIVLTDLCAKITTGERLPDRQGLDPKGSIIYFVAEDNLSDTVRIRAEDAGADLDKFIVTTGEKKDGGFFSIVDPDDRRSLETQIKKLADIQAVVFDPISTYMSGLRTNDENEVRAALAPLNRMAEKYQLAIIGVSHLNKDQAKRALYRLSGSIAFVAVARTVWLVKKDEDSDLRYFAPLKYNILKDPTTLAFKIYGPIGRPRVEFESMPVDITSEELLADEDQKQRISAIAEARIFLDGILPSGTEKPQKEIMRDAKSESHSQRTLSRAKKQLGIISEKKFDGWHWRRT